MVARERVKAVACMAFFKMSCMGLFCMLLAALAGKMDMACGAKIVAVPFVNCLSHALVAAKICVELAARGHEVRWVLEGMQGGGVCGGGVINMNVTQ